MATLKIELFGRFSAERAGRPLEGLHSGKVQELFSYILINRTRVHSRESLASLLWSNSTTVVSKKLLRQAFWQLQAGLENGRGKKEAPVLLVEPDWARVNPAADFTLDVATFERAVCRVQGIPGQKMDRKPATELKEAVELYTASLLDGCYQEWCLFERERLETLILGALDKLMSYCTKHRELEAGMAYGSRILTLDRARERTHRKLMRLQWLAGDRTGALRQYESCRKTLKEELEVQPSHRTEALLKQIQSDGAARPTAVSLGRSALSATKEDFSKTGLTLQQALAALEGLQRLAERAIHAVGEALNRQEQSRSSSNAVESSRPVAPRRHSSSGEIAL